MSEKAHRPLSISHRDPNPHAGSLRSCNPDRVVLKRVVLSGYPVRVHKKKAVVRWMFHNPEDVRWFRPLELWTKHGLRGRITVRPGSRSALIGWMTFLRPGRKRGSEHRGPWLLMVATIS